MEKRTECFAAGVITGIIIVCVSMLFIKTKNAPLFCWRSGFLIENSDKSYFLRGESGLQIKAFIFPTFYRNPSINELEKLFGKKSDAVVTNIATQMFGANCFTKTDFEEYVRLVNTIDGAGGYDPPGVPYIFQGEGFYILCQTSLQQSNIK